MLLGCKKQYISKETLIKAAERMKVTPAAERQEKCQREFPFSYSTLCNRMREHGISFKQIKIINVEYQG